MQADELCGWNLTVPPPGCASPCWSRTPRLNKKNYHSIFQKYRDQVRTFMLQIEIPWTALTSEEVNSGLLKRLYLLYVSMYLCMQCSGSGSTQEVHLRVESSVPDPDTQVLGLPDPGPLLIVRIQIRILPSTSKTNKKKPWFLQFCDYFLTCCL